MKYIHRRLKFLSSGLLICPSHWGSLPWHTELHRPSDEHTFSVKALLQQEFRAQSSAQSCQLLKSVLHWASASHQTGFSWSRAFETSRCKGKSLYTRLYALHRLFQQRGLVLCSLLLCTGTLRSQALFDAAVEGAVSGFIALFLNKTELNVLKMVSDI